MAVQVNWEDEICRLCVMFARIMANSYGNVRELE